MGLALKDAKTRFAHTLEAKEECGGNVGFDFLGFTIRQFPVGKDQTTPISAERNSATIWEETGQFLPRKSEDLRRQG
jgi:hypothetical protein